MGRAPKIYETPREHETLIVAAVGVFGFLVAFPGVMVLTGALPRGIVSLPVANGAQYVAIAEAVLGLGLILRKEFARRAFVALACAGIVYFAVEVVQEHAGRTVSPGTHVSTQGVVAGEQGGPAATVRAPEEGGTALLGLFSLMIPAVFLTRPVVRRVFH